MNTRAVGNQPLAFIDEYARLARNSILTCITIGTAQAKPKKMTRIFLTGRAIGPSIKN